MEIQQFFNKDLIFIDQEIKNKTEAISFISLKLKSNNFIADFTQTQSEFSSREEQVSTYLGDFIAMPHIRNKKQLKNNKNKCDNTEIKIY